MSTVGTPPPSRASCEQSRQTRLSFDSLDTVLHQRHYGHTTRRVHEARARARARRRRQFAGSSIHHSTETVTPSHQNPTRLNEYFLAARRLPLNRVIGRHNEYASIVSAETRAHQHWHPLPYSLLLYRDSLVVLGFSACGRYIIAYRLISRERGDKLRFNAAAHGRPLPCRILSASWLTS
ncbi:uncharacterized protein MONBRDRAFT_8834 [Monosiga brevicollis MX1]|uniref:Uncharacterized protein n=1 Tax=Monosiga brevicollis TaxID=81824 RepID=A9V194_MONBE|nr:uncharacterized protein MONBRDRAFT_8834 [Monosiga brevicollis MX1]EDQ88892.1 predicted protein [Monosiga brevicollis MX1]|eukprot:XP_001746505.1 hypothetical protein [Monosiga brevicollis MX1]